MNTGTLRRTPIAVLRWILSLRGYSSAFIIAIVALALFPANLRAQEGTWSLSASVGYGISSFSDVDAKNSRDVEGYNNQGLPIDEIPSLKAAPLYEAKLIYRFTREFGFSLGVLYTKNEVSTEYTSPDDYLFLKRSVSSTDIMVGLAYYPSAQPRFLEWYAQVDLGMLLGRASAETFGTHTYKVGGQPDIRPTIDTKGNYKKSKLDVAARLGAEVQLPQNFLLRAEGGYRFAVLGKLPGDVSRLGEPTTSVESTVDFDYSAMFISLGIGINF